MAGTKRSHRKTQGNRRRCVKTGRFIATSAPRDAGLCASLLLNKELFRDFLLFVDAHSIATLCKAVAFDRLARRTLHDGAWWRGLLQAHCHVDNVATVNVHRSILLGDGCGDLVDYLNLRNQLECFEEHVKVVKGDLGNIESVGDLRVDCLVFPTSANYRNPHTGVSGCVHARAGPDLDRAVANVGLRTSAKAGGVLCTVGCDSGARLLVHCVGPSGNQQDSDALLYKTYVNALRAADTNHVECAAVASISTGILRFPVPRAADIALSAVRDLIRLNPCWAVTIAFVCVDDNVYQHFCRAREEYVHAFHTTGFTFPRVLNAHSVAQYQAADAA